MSEIVNAPDLSDEVRAALRRHILSLADTKRILGLRYSDWLLGAPSIETGIAASSMSQDEWGHARLLYAMLKDFGEDPTGVEHDRPAERYASIPAVDEPFPDWAGFVAAMVVVDGALSTALEGFAEGRFEQARSRVPKMLAEEEFHRDMGLAWLRRLREGSDEARVRIRDAVRAALPGTLAWLAPGDAPFRTLVDAGLTAPADVLLKRFDAVYGDALRAAGAESLEPDFSGWDESRGRGSGAPAEEVVERARGDRNRALLVE
ncbi:MAG TPA: Phenylacetic acid catabolic protein [Longimicrobiales bacterium]|nr:Phenylacetic acid catabolic protein [Longimicrobiales bacterium]